MNLSRILPNIAGIRTPEWHLMNILVVPLVVVAFMTWSELRTLPLYSILDNYRFYRTMETFLVRLDEVSPPNQILLFGDSNFQPLPSSAIAPNMINFSIGGENSSGVLSRIKQYKSVKSAAQIILAVGTNDSRYTPSSETRRNFRKIFDVIPPKTPVTILSVLPVNPTYAPAKAFSPARIAQLNSSLKKLCGSFPSCKFVSLTRHFANRSLRLRKEFTIDGIHLSSSGRSRLTQRLRDLLNKPA